MVRTENISQYSLQSTEIYQFFVHERLFVYFSFFFLAFICCNRNINFLCSSGPTSFFSKTVLGNQWNFSFFPISYWHDQPNTIVLFNNSIITQHISILICIQDFLTTMSFPVFSSPPWSVFILRSCGDSFSRFWPNLCSYFCQVETIFFSLSLWGSDAFTNSHTHRDQ